MKVYKPVSPLILSLLLVNLTACLTLNVNMNFPESAVQQATDNYVQDLYRQKEKGRPARKDSDLESEPTTTPNQSPKNKSQFRLKDWIGMPEAIAADLPQMRMNTPKAIKIREKLASWLPEVLTQKRTGILGETKDGQLVIKSPDKLKKLLQKKSEQLVADENQARNELYNEVITANQMSKDRLPDVKRSFAHSFQAESPSGTWIESDKGEWIQKE